jgi:sec-independent protein translocase protein TatA
MPDLGVPELLIVLVVAFLLFGAKKLPELARSIGRSASEFKKGIREGGADEETPAASKETGPHTPSTGDASA